MISRERVLQALNHRQPDRVPIDCGGHRSSSFSITAYQNLRAYLGLSPDTLYLYDMGQQLVIPNDDIYPLLGIDVVDVDRTARDDPAHWKDWVQQDGTPVKIPASLDVRREGADFWMYNARGKRMAVQKENCLYFEQTYYPRAGDTSDDFSNLEEQFSDIGWAAAPADSQTEAVKKRKAAAQALRVGTGKAVYGAVGGNLYEASHAIYKIDNALINLAAEPKMMHAFLDKVLEINMRNLDHYLAACGDAIDVLGFGDDFGMQTGPQISTQMYVEFFKPRQKILWTRAKKQKPHLKLCLHSCGGIAPLIPHMIEAGIDAINPVQITCAGMEPTRLKREFGKDIVFWGGGCDTRAVLPHGTPQEVKDHVRKNLDVFFRDGGYVFQQVHNILANVPPQNIVAMFEAVREYA